MKVAIIGGGAAGFFAAISTKTHNPEIEVFILEKTKRTLSKVKVSGGGRCNVTNACTYIPDLILAYPRGAKLLKGAFRTFSTQDTMDWFQSRNIPLTIQEDNCVFPVSQDSQSIIDGLTKEANKLGVKIWLGKSIESIDSKETGGFNLKIQRQDQTEFYDKVIVTTGGSPKRKGLNWLEDLGHKIEPPVPSLFTFNMPMESITKLMGIVVENATVNIQGTKLKSSGPLLITHWGMSGPAILKLSAFGARILADKQYTFKTQVNWTSQNREEVEQTINQIVRNNPQKSLTNAKAFNLQSRLWNYLLQKAGLELDKKWAELGKKGINRFIEILTNDIYDVSGKTTFKEEFVTCGGVSLKSINPKTMESKPCPGLYFAGEVIDIDGITGGYNFQAAWTTGFIAGKLNS